MSKNVKQVVLWMKDANTSNLFKLSMELTLDASFFNIVTQRLIPYYLDVYTGKKDNQMSELLFPRGRNPVDLSSSFRIWLIYF